tara:strand:+ start:486 stop:797 length:312 start_codon:yes stop_codon:yes gene_type:complete
MWQQLQLYAQPPPQQASRGLKLQTAAQQQTYPPQHPPTPQRQGRAPLQEQMQQQQPQIQQQQPQQCQQHKLQQAPQQFQPAQSPKPNCTPPMNQPTNQMPKHM